MEWLMGGERAAAPLDVHAMLLGLLLSFLAGQLLAWVYMLTHTGLSYSRSFVNSLIIIPVIVSLVMLVLSNNLVTAFGLMAVFAIVRFRNILRDTMDTTYVLGVIVVGMACGTQKFSSAVIGTLLTAGILIYLWYTSFGSRQRYDLILNLRWSRPLGELPELGRLLERHAIKAHCASQRAQDDSPGADLSYRLLLRDPSRTHDLMAELQTLNGIAHVMSMKAEDESEI
ncbi:MAG: DUF4956 domain-containing protein [Verrucomicrobia bacterium]|nr:DUF4956 domain-containing protein [Verrucomicrobiota bacterium]